MALETFLLGFGAATFSNGACYRKLKACHIDA